MTERRAPAVIEDLDSLPAAPASPDEAPEIGAPSTAVAETTLRVAARRPGVVARIFWAGFGGLLTMALGLWFWDVVDGLFARNIWLGRAALGFGALAGLGLLAMAVSEMAALARLGKSDALRDAAGRARRSADRAGALGVVDGLTRLYRGRADLAAPRAEVQAAAPEILDADALLDMVERRCLGPLDEAAADAARRAARNIAAITALAPLALVDVLAALAINLRMIREIAEIYGGRAGWFGSLRLLRAVAAHLVAAGGLAAADDLIGPALGGGALSKLSRRFGEGMVNGALTARIGVAAMEVCRPMPFAALPKPGVAGLLKDALARIMRRAPEA